MARHTERDPQLGTGGVLPRRRRPRRLLVLALVAVLWLLALGAGGVWWSTSHYGDRVNRIPHAFPHGRRPAKPGGTAGAMNVLLAGVDRRSDRPTTGSDRKAPLWQVGAQRSDTLMLVHLAPGERKAYAVSIPRDSWVSVPRHGSAKINAAFSWGGPPLLIETVEKLTGIRIDHFAVVDWQGFRSLTDAVGGVPLTVPSDTSDSEQRRHWKAGTYTMNGDQALAFVRQRDGLPDGDLDRMKRQQEFLRSLMGKVHSRISITSLSNLDRVLSALTRVVSVDDQLSNAELRDLAFSLRNLDIQGITFTTVPVDRLGWMKGQSVMILDQNKSRALWSAFAKGRLP